MYMITDGMQPKHLVDRVVHLLAAAVGRTMRTTSPDNSGSHHKWRTGQPHHQAESLLRVQGPGLEGRPGHRAV